MKIDSRSEPDSTSPAMGSPVGHVRPTTLMIVDGHELIRHGVRQILETDPEPPSTASRRAAARGATTRQPIGRRLSRDLDAICLKALRKNPTDRYGSVTELAADLERYLAGRPIAARGDDFRYRAGRATEAAEWEGANAGNVTSFGVDAAGEMYVMNADGVLYRLASAAPAPTPAQPPSGGARGARGGG